MERADFRPEAGAGVRQLGGRGEQVLLTRKKKKLTLQEQIARVGLAISDVGVGLAVKELTVDIEPRHDVGRQQPLAVGTGAANTRGRQEGCEIGGLAKCRRGHVAVIHRSGRLEQALIVFESRPAFFESYVKTAQLEVNAAAIQIRRIAQVAGNRELVGVRDEDRGARAVTGVAVIGEIRNKPVPRQQIELKAGKMAMRVE